MKAARLVGGLVTSRWCQKGASSIGVCSENYGTQEQDPKLLLPSRVYVSTLG